MRPSQSRISPIRYRPGTSLDSIVWYLISSKLVAGTAVSLFQVYAFLAIAWFWEIEPPPIGYLTVIPALILSGLMMGALGMLVSSLIKQLENFAGVMNFVIFPMFFASSALYPLWRVLESSPALYYVCQFNPFTHAVELCRCATSSAQPATSTPSL